MAEGLARHLAQGRLVPQSAGIEPKGIHPLAIFVMDEMGIDIRKQGSKALEPELLAQADLVITLCGHADARCPLLPPQVKKIHWPLSDPAVATGSQIERKKTFRKIRDEIKARLLKLLQEGLPA